jgi:RNA polymerase sigma factor (sigma-70 family)
MPDYITQSLKFYSQKFKLDYDDLSQDIQIKILENKHKFKTQEGGTFGSWVNFMIRNHCIDLTRKKENRVFFCTFKERHSNSCTQSLEARQYIASLFWKVRRNWPRQRKSNTRILWLVMSGCSYKQISTDVGLAENTLKPRIFFIRKFLEKYR